MTMTGVCFVARLATPLTSTPSPTTALRPG
jgi:hypothetical protein